MKAYFLFFLCASAYCLLWTSEEEAGSEGNKRPGFPPLGLQECRGVDKLLSFESENDQKQSVTAEGASSYEGAGEGREEGIEEKCGRIAIGEATFRR